MNNEDKSIRKLVRQKRDTERAVKKNLTEEEHKKQIKKWTTFFRRNLDIYAEDYLQIPLKPYQRIMMHLMGISNTFFAICARLSAKSFIVSLYALCICLLKPFSWVVITSSTLDQGRKMIDAKIKNEFIFKISPVLKYMYDEGMITIVSSKDECIVRFFNNSYIKVLPPTESSRGEIDILIFII